jgi:hypothetical protein
MDTEQHHQWPKHGVINIFRLKDYSLSQENEICLDNRSRTKAGTTSSHIADMSGTIDDPLPLICVGHQFFSHLVLQSLSFLLIQSSSVHSSPLTT